MVPSYFLFVVNIEGGGLFVVKLGSIGLVHGLVRVVIGYKHPRGMTLSFRFVALLNHVSSILIHALFEAKVLHNNSH